MGARGLPLPWSAPTGKNLSTSPSESESKFYSGGEEDTRAWVPGHRVWGWTILGPACQVSQGAAVEGEEVHVSGDTGQLANELHTVVSRFWDFSDSKGGLFVNSLVSNSASAFWLRGALAPDVVCSGRVMGCVPLGSPSACGVSCHYNDGIMSWSGFPAPWKDLVLAIVVDSRDHHRSFLPVSCPLIAPTWRWGLWQLGSLWCLLLLPHAACSELSLVSFYPTSCGHNHVDWNNINRYYSYNNNINHIRTRWNGIHVVIKVQKSIAGRRENFSTQVQEL